MKRKHFVILILICIFLSSVVQAAQVQNLKLWVISSGQSTGPKWRAIVQYDVVFNKLEMKLPISYRERVLLMEVDDDMDQWSYPEYSSEVHRTYVFGDPDDIVYRFPEGELKAIAMGGPLVWHRNLKVDIPEFWKTGAPETGDEELVAVVIIEPKIVHLDIAYSNHEVKDIGEDPSEPLPWE